jgi:hypothetical protein
MMIPDKFQFNSSFFNNKSVEDQLRKLGFAIWKKDQHQLEIVPPVGWSVVIDKDGNKNFYNMGMILKISIRSNKLYLW